MQTTEPQLLLVTKNKASWPKQKSKVTDLSDASKSPTKRRMPAGRGQKSPTGTVPVGATPAAKAVAGTSVAPATSVAPVAPDAPVAPVAPDAPVVDGAIGAIGTDDVIDVAGPAIPVVESSSSFFTKVIKAVGGVVPMFRTSEVAQTATVPTEAAVVETTPTATETVPTETAPTVVEKIAACCAAVVRRTVAAYKAACSWVCSWFGSKTASA